MEIAGLQALENQGAHQKIEQLLSAKSLKDAEVLKYASAYYVRRGNASKSLAYYAEYLQNTPAGKRELSATVFAIQCARRLKRHELVRDYFFALPVAEREKMHADDLSCVAASLIDMGLFDEAEKVIRFIRHKSNLPQLMHFDELIEKKFGSRQGASAYAAQNPKASNEGDVFKSVQNALSLALAHMAGGNFTAAEKILENCRHRVAA